MFLVIVTMEAKDYAEMEPRYTQLLSDIVDSNIKLLNTMRMYGAAQDAALGRENKEEQVEYVNRIKQGNKVAKSYNMFNDMFGNGTGRRMDEGEEQDVHPNIQRPKFYGGSIAIDKAKSEKTRKSYELLRLMTGGS
jgi:hypothetical protein